MTEKGGGSGRLGEKIRYNPAAADFPFNAISRSTKKPNTGCKGIKALATLLRTFKTSETRQLQKVQ